jgi:hypothetical protein
MPDFLIFLGLLGGAIALYVLLITLLPRYLPPEAVRGPLQWAHRGSGALLLVALVVSCSARDLSIRYPVFFSLLLVGSGLLGGLWAKVGVAPGKARAIARAHAWLTPLLIPVLPWWVGFRDSDVVYWDSHVSIELVKNPGMISEIPTTEITLYESRFLIFEHPIGRIVTANHDKSAPHPNEAFEKKEWWPTVRAVAVDTDSLKGVVQTDSRPYPFVLYQLGDPSSLPPAAAAPVPEPVEVTPLPAEDERVYTYVDEMPQLPGHRGSVVRALSQWLSARLVLPRGARKGRVFLSVVVTKAGAVRDLRIVKGLNAGTDSAVLAAAKQLPLLIPGRQNGLSMNVGLVLVADISPKPQARRSRGTQK